MSAKWSFQSPSKQSKYGASTLKVIIMLAFLVFAVGILITVPIHTVHSGDSVCKTLEGATFRSDKESGDPFGGRMHPSIAFRDGLFDWSVSDMLIGGTYKCTSEGISAFTSYDHRPQTVQLDATTGILVWNGDLYKKTYEPAVILGQNSNSGPDPIISKIVLITLLIGLLIAELIILASTIRKVK